MSEKPFSLTPKQKEANRLLGSSAQQIQLEGGSRSGKTFIIVRAIVVRALKAPGSRHISMRFKFSHIKSSIILDTFPKVMRLCFPTVEYELSKSDWYVKFQNLSEYWFAGLDDKERTEKILGNEYSTIHLNECSQIKWDARNTAVTRLAQLIYEYERRDGQYIKTSKNQGRVLPLKMYYDQNPPDKAHWTYRIFHLKQDPDSKGPLPNPENYAVMQMNPDDNKENLSPEYIKTLETLPARLRKRFLEGKYREAAPNALFAEEMFDKHRFIDEELPELVRIVVAIDPSGADDDNNQEADDIGIIVCGLTVTGKGLVLEDSTVKAGPATWGRVAVSAYDRWNADAIVGEVNFGGAMVRHVIHSVRPKIPFRAVRASRGKAVRAEPISALFEKGDCAMAGIFRDLEDELCGMTTHGYMGERSPNRADAGIWALSDLFPGILQIKEEKPTPAPKPIVLPRPSGQGWMGG